MVSLVSSFIQHSARILTFAIIRQALSHFPDIQEGIPIIHAGRPHHGLLPRSLQSVSMRSRTPTVCRPRGQGPVCGLFLSQHMLLCPSAFLQSRLRLHGWCRWARGSIYKEKAAETKQHRAVGMHSAGSQSGFWSQLCVELFNLNLDVEVASGLASVSAPTVGLGGADLPFQSQIL